MGHVVSFSESRRPWARWERAVLGQLQIAFEQQGLKVDCEHGVSDNGTPWTVFYGIETGDFVAHVARHGRGYVLLWPDQSSVRVAEMEKLVPIVRSSTKLQSATRPVQANSKNRAGLSTRFSLPSTSPIFFASALHHQVGD